MRRSWRYRSVLLCGAGRFLVKKTLIVSGSDSVDTGPRLLQGHIVSSSISNVPHGSELPIASAYSDKAGLSIVD